MKRLIVKSKKKFHDVRGFGEFIRQEVKIKIIYSFIDEEKNTFFEILLPLVGRPQISDIIIEENKDFVNGFKVVKTANDEYGYIRESDNKLLPYRYDIALDFNEYGLAMVGKDGYVTWINTKFQYLNTDGELVSYDNDILNQEHCFTDISDFSESKNPLSRVSYSNYNSDTFTKYINTNGEVQSFTNYNGETLGSFRVNVFSYGNKFDESGFAEADGFILSSEGYCIHKDNLFKIMKEKGFLNIITADVAELQTQQELSRELKKRD